jgi:transposase
MLQEQILLLEKRIRERIPENWMMQLLKTLPGVGDILSIVIACEIGLVERFPGAEYLASYAGVVPGVKGSGDKVRYGRLPKQANHYLKWAYIEAANSVSSHCNAPNWRQKHVTLLYERVRRRKGHSVAAGAVARHLAEASYWILTKKEPYRDPVRKKVLPRQG